MMRILFVDDQQRELDGMTRMLNWAELGAEVAGAVTDGRAALEIAKTQPIDVVISDVIMQNMDGLTLVRELKACRPQIKTICISGFDDFKFVSMAINNGASGYVLKPILVNEIRQVLERVFEEIRKERRLQARRQEIDRSLLALLCVGAENWCGGLSEEEKDTPVRLAYGLRLPVGECLCRLDMHGGECLCLLGAGMQPPQGALVSSEIPLREAREAFRPDAPLSIAGSDIDPEALTLCGRHIRQAGLEGRVRVHRQDLKTLTLEGPAGVFLLNPPYGERLSDREGARALYRELGLLIRRHPGWRLCALSADPGFERAFGRRADKKRRLYNGRLECDFFLYLSGGQD